MMTQAGKAVFIDTNVLIYAKLALSPFHLTAVDRLKELDSQRVHFWVSRQVFREYVSAMSRPGVLTGSIPMLSLTADVRDFAGRFEVADEDARTTVHWLSLLEQIPTSGKQVHDANIVATMLANNIYSLLTHNVSDFARFSALISVLPLVQ